MYNIICISIICITIIFILLRIEHLTNQNHKIDKIYYINLDRRPDRNLHFLKLYNELNLGNDKLKRFTGIDGLTYKFSPEQNNMFINADFLNTDAKTKIMGNQLSHYYILNDMINNNYNYILIFQDDVIFRYDFVEQINKLMNNIPNDAEIINFGFHKTANLSEFEALDINDPVESIVQSKKIINDSVCILADNVNPCSLSYLVTLQGAKNLVKYFNEYGFRRATDWNYTDYLVNKNINYATRIVLCTGNHNFASDIFL
jgi:GR25 family glycosyltransferase involved in LPS biosynthesis